LIRKMKGDEKRVQEEISKWWNEPVPVKEEQWVTKSSTKKKAPNNENLPRNARNGAGGRGFRNAPGRGPPQGGRGSGAERRRERPDRREGGLPRHAPAAVPTPTPTAPAPVPTPTPAAPTPTPSAVPVPRGVWGKVRLAVYRRSEATTAYLDPS